MVAAATALCLDATNVHRQTGVKKSAVAFVSLADAVVESKKMALNFGFSATTISNTSPAAEAPKKVDMDSLVVSAQNHMRQISPGTAALRKINEVLALSSSSASASPSTPLQQQHSSDENSPGTNEALVQLAEQYKDQLMKTIDSNNFDEVSRLIGEIEEAGLSKSALEISRIGAVVNTLRRNIATTHPDLARKCRSLIKSWRSNVEAVNGSSRPSSSCGSSSGTPSLVSPALRRGITPRGKTITPTSQLAYEGYTANPSYAPSDPNNKISPQLSQKRKNVSPNVTASATKRAKLSPAAAAPISVIEARRNVQSTEQLVAALGMDTFLNSNAVTKKPENVVQNNGMSKSEPISIPTINNQSPEKRGRKKKESKIETSAPVVPRLKIRFGGKSAEEHDAEETAKTVNNELPEAIPSTSTAINPSKPSTSKKITKKETKPEFSWYDKLPTAEDLELRSKKPSGLIAEKSEDPTDPATWKYKERTIVLMPYLDDDEPDFLLYNYPDKERYMAPKRPF